MFEELYHRQSQVARHKNGPYAEERARYLAFRASAGMPRRALVRIAEVILWVARLVPVAPGTNVTADDIGTAADVYALKTCPTPGERGRAQARALFVREATRWFHFMNRLSLSTKKCPPHEKVVSDYCHWMKNEQGLTCRTIRNRYGWIRLFLSWYGPLKHSLSAARARDVDVFFASFNNHQRWSRATMASILQSLRGFFRYAASRGLCRSSIADGIPGPRLYHHANLPMGPSREDVIHLIESFETNSPADIRNRAMVLLCVFYGLRASEVTNLRLEDIDWERERIHVVQAKSKAENMLPLMPTVGNAIYRYLKDVRPRCARREVFLTFGAPYRPLHQIHSVISQRLKALAIGAPYQGSHGIRHALACYLLREKQPLKVIGDILGHRSCESTRVYAKVDLSSLRHVALLDLGDVL